jgi:hypothetical protein
MKLEPIKAGSWSFRVDDSTTGTSIEVRLHARNGDGHPCLEPGPALVAAAEATERNAMRLRDEFLQQIGYPDPAEFLENIDIPHPSFTLEELRNPSEEVLLRIRSQARLLHISVEQLPGGSIHTCGYVADALSRVWEVGDDYVEGCFRINDFLT